MSNTKTVLTWEERTAEWKRIDKIAHFRTVKSLEKAADLAILLVYIYWHNMKRWKWPHLVSLALSLHSVTLMILGYHKWSLEEIFSSALLPYILYAFFLMIWIFNHVDQKHARQQKRREQRQQLEHS